MTGVLHTCPKTGGLSLFNPNLHSECPLCGEDLTKKPMKMYDIGKPVEAKIV